MTQIGMTIAGRLFQGVNAGGAVYFDPDGNEEVIGVIKAGQLSVKNLPVAVSAQGLFATQTGAVYYLEAHSQNLNRFVPIDDTLTPPSDPSLAIQLYMYPAVPAKIHALRSYGFFGQCVRDSMFVDCFSADGRTVREASGADASNSVDPTALWGVLKSTPVAAKWDGQTWVEESHLQARAPNIVAVFPLQGSLPDRVLAFAATDMASEAYYLNGTCWQPLHNVADVDIGFSDRYAAPTLLQLDDRRVAWIGGSSIKIVHLDDFSNF
jgi:hypothetical protein